MKGKIAAHAQDPHWTCCGSLGLLIQFSTITTVGAVCILPRAVLQSSKTAMRTLQEALIQQC